MCEGNCGCQKIERTVMYITKNEIINLYNHMMAHPTALNFNLYFHQFGFGRELEVEVLGLHCKQDITDYSI